MTLRIYNTLNRQIEDFIPGGEIKEKNEDYPPVLIYSCGPTVYDYAHIGNLKTFIFNDFLRRYLKFRGFKVNQAMNITDVDDKTILGAQQEGISLRKYTDRYIKAFFDDLKKLNIEEVEHTPRATESIQAMDEIINRLSEKGYLYSKEGSLYFKIDQFRNYGLLSGLDKSQMKTGLRYDTDEYDKDDVRDFVVWKATKKGEDSWQIALGKGRPGWHIECSAMVRKIFGQTIDIHTGGVDLVFPHHENEIAQSEAAYQEKFVRYWIHAEHLLVDGSKMSKSKGNFYTLPDLLSKGYSPRTIRYLFLTVHYRKQLNFTLAGLKQAEQALTRIDNFISRLNEVKAEGKGNSGTTEKITDFLAKFTAAVDEDLNISKGLGIFFDFIHKINALIDQESLTTKDKEEISGVLEKIDQVFGFIFFKDVVPEVEPSLGEDKIEDLIKERNLARQQKNYQRSDEIRDFLLENNIILEDAKDGTRWKRK